MLKPNNQIPVGYLREPPSGGGSGLPEAARRRDRGWIWRTSATSAVSETRKLAAILVADVVGYSRLTGADEDRILARLRALRSDLIDPTIAVHHGRAVKRTGDGAIVEFRSVVDAVNCALEIQGGPCHI
jgi:class 3 adenylate cyclase